MNFFILTFNKKINPKKFIKNILVIVGILLFFISTINFIVDPLYYWKITKKIDFKRRDFDERVQKTNYLANIDNNYNAVLLGNSRSTYIDTKKFNLGVNIYNYSVNAMSVYEYEQVILNFIELTGKEPEKILIGIDPFDFKGDNTNRLKYILEETKDNTLKYKNLFSSDVFLFSIKSIIKTIKTKFDYYDRKQRYYDNNLTKGNNLENRISNKKYISIKKDKNLYKVDKNLFKEYERLKNKFSNSEFIIYCLPFHKDLIQNWKKDKLFNEKNKYFLENITSIFEKVYYFNYINNYNSSYSNYYDKYHFYPYLGNILASKISDLYNNKKSDFGYILNKEDIERKKYSKEK